MMSDRATGTAARFADSLSNISPQFTARRRVARQLLASTDPFERVAPVGLLGEAAGRFIAESVVPLRSVALFMDRTGDGDGARAAASLIGLVGEAWPRCSFVHVAFATPTRGMGALLRGNLTRAGAEAKVLVDVVARNRPFEGLQLSSSEAEELVSGCDLVVTYASGGVAGLVDPTARQISDELLAHSHIAVCSFPDPESLVAELAPLAETVEREPGIDSLRFIVQAESDGVFAEVGHAVLGVGGDAQERLWVLLDNARRLRYRVVLEPWNGGEPSSASILCPCQTLLEEALLPDLVIGRIVRAGTRLVAVGRGRATLT